MLSSMPVNRQRKESIQSHMKKQAEDVGGIDHLPRGKLIIKGRPELAPIYRLGLGDLAFNKANGRIHAEVREKEDELGHELDAWDQEAQRTIRDILLLIRPDENEKICEDLRKNGQLQPGIITCDGIVVNGNRRKALLETLCEQTGDERFQYLEVQVLPSDITKAELWLIEAGIQLSAPQQLDYSPVNHLLKLREGIDAGLRREDMAARIYGVSEDQIREDLERLDLIDEYLSDFLDRKDRYFLVQGLNEHFIDLQNMLSWVKHPRGRVRRDWDPDENDINELKIIGFYYIRIKMPHLRIRQLRDLFATHSSWDELQKALDVDTGLTPEERSQLRLHPVPIGDIEVDEDESEFVQSVAPAAEEASRQEEALWRNKRQRQLQSIYEDAKEQEQIVKDKERPLALAKRALNNLNAIPLEPDCLAEPGMDDVLREIIQCTNVLRKAVKASGNSHASEDGARAGSRKTETPNKKAHK
jgi:hypothetical protein